MPTKPEDIGQMALPVACGALHIVRHTGMTEALGPLVLTCQRLAGHGQHNGTAAKTHCAVYIGGFATWTDNG